MMTCVIQKKRLKKDLEKIELHKMFNKASKILPLEIARAL